MITRIIFHECGTLAESGDTTLQRATSSAAKRFEEQVRRVEECLAQYNLPATESELYFEKEILARCVSRAKCRVEVEAKAKAILEEYVPRVVQPRLERLHQLSKQLETDETPSFILDGPKPIRVAFETLKHDKVPNLRDRAQHAFMKLCLLNWKPQPVPEYLPIVHYQTVANVRDKTMKQLTAAQKTIVCHEQGILDFSAFLITTSLLSDSSEPVGRQL